MAVAAFAWLGDRGLGDVRQTRFPLFVPGSEMRAVADALAGSANGLSIDVGYDLARGIEWIPGRACNPEHSWYSIGRQYDWLFRRRYGLTNVHEGTCTREAASTWQIGYAGMMTASEMEVVQVFGHLEIRRQRIPR
jgi:hypothetical protein